MPGPLSAPHHIAQRPGKRPQMLSRGPHPNDGGALPASGGCLGTTIDSLSSWGGATVWEALLGHSSVPQFWGLGQVARPFSDLRFFICRWVVEDPADGPCTCPPVLGSRKPVWAACSHLLATRPLGRRQGWLCPGPPCSTRLPARPAGPGLPETPSHRACAAGTEPNPVTDLSAPGRSLPPALSNPKAVPRSSGRTGPVLDKGTLETHAC